MGSRRAAPAVTRVVAVDWSGRQDDAGQRRGIWLCEWDARGLVRLEAGRTRAEVTDELVRVVRAPGRALVGLDFAFGYPAWFTRAHAGGQPAALWALAAREGDAWLARCAPPFWGRPGKPRPADDPARPGFRACELALAPIAGIRPKSVFQVGGAGAVGTGSIRGMATLLALREAGAQVWPFDDDGAGARVVEVWPRLLTGAVVKSSEGARTAHLRAARLTGSAVRAATGSEDAFDALLTARAMWHYRDHGADGTPATALTRLEGDIWRPDPARARRLPPLAGHDPLSR